MEATVSLLHFWNRNKLERDGRDEDGDEVLAAADPLETVEATASHGGNGASAPASRRTGGDSCATLPGPSNGNKLNLEEIRAALDKIAEIIHDDEERERKAETSGGNFTAVEFCIRDVVNLVPHLFRDRERAAGSPGKVSVWVEDLFEQLKSGKVTTTVRRVVAEVEEDLLVPEYVECQKDTVSIPLHLAVTAVRPDELKKRTARTERDSGLDAMPNLFSPPSEAGTPKPHLLETDDLLKPKPAASARPKPPPPAPPAAVPQPPAPAPSHAADQDEDTVFRRRSLPDRPSRLPDGRSLDVGIGSRFDPDPKPELGPKAPEEGTGMRFEIGEQTDLFKRSSTPAAPAPQPPAPRAPAVPKAEEPAPVPPVPAESVPVDAGRLPTMDEHEARTLDDDEAADESALPALARDGVVRLKGVDLNTASKRELMERLDGVGIKLAERIERHRRLHGPFRSLADLTRIPGVGPSTFERITGQSWSEARDDTRRTLDYLLGPDSEPMPDLRAAAKRFCALPSCEGCIFTHEDGHVLASEWDHPSQQVLGAVIPQLFKKMEPYMDQLELGEVNPLTLFFGDIGITMVRCGDTYLALVHRIGRLSKRQIQLVQLASAELESRMDRVRSQK
jgi:competence ComEA-like helix-hairpin-helix protein